MSRVPAMRLRMIAVAGFCGMSVLAGASHALAQNAGLGAAVELVDPKTLRVCADPRNLPFSDDKGEGFENKLAALLAAKLGKELAYTYYPQSVGFVRNTLNALRCDLVIGTAQGDDIMQTTIPYYHTVYALVVKAGSGLQDVKTLADPRLKDRRLGIVAGTPPATIMVEQGLMEKARPYPLTIDTRFDSSSHAMIDDLLGGEIDAGILWGPMAGYYAREAGGKLAVVPLLDEHAARLDFRISMGVRHSDQNWKRQLNQLISANHDDINRILLDYGVPLLDEQGSLVQK